MGFICGDYDTAKINFENDYHKTNPADINHESIIKRNDERNSKELEAVKECRLTIVTKNVLEYAYRLKRDTDFSSDEIDDKAGDKREKPVQNI